MKNENYEKRLEELIEEHWDKEYVSQYEVWRVLRMVGEEFIFNLIKVRETLVSHYAKGEEGSIKYSWQKTMGEEGMINEEMASLCKALRNEVVDNYFNSKEFTEQDIWGGIRKLEKRWIVEKLNEMTEDLETQKENKKQPQAFYSAEEILAEIADYEEPKN